VSAIAITSAYREQRVFEPSSASGDSSGVQLLLDLAMLQTKAKGAYVYRFDEENAAASLAACAGPPLTGNLPHVRQRLQRAAASHRNRKTPVVLASGAAADWRFSGFPEFQSGAFDAVISVPLPESGRIVGVANFCQAAGEPVNAASLSFLIDLSIPLGALVMASTLREQLRKATQDLADRKVLERAKGLLQAKFQWTEEEAYLRLRRTSRRRRVPMREIAREVIERGLSDLAEVKSNDRI